MTVNMLPSCTCMLTTVTVPRDRKKLCVTDDSRQNRKDEDELDIYLNSKSCIMIHDHDP